MAHEHGPHTCYCPSCGGSIEVEPYIQCNTINCPQCGTRMRATETGEYRVGARVSASVATNSIACPVCGYPIPAPSAIGEEVKCAYCGSISQAIQAVTIPSTVFVGFITFGLGAILGPALWEAAKGGAKALERVARERIH
jgi:hypothetical protein